MIQYVVTQERPGTTRTLVADYSARVRNLVFASNNRGFAECTGFIPMGLSESFALYNTIGSLRVQICDTSSGAIYDGRVEDVAIVGDGVTITALGYSRALSDAPYTALWSTTLLSEWAALTAADIAGSTPEKYGTDKNNRLYMTLTKGATYLNVLDYGVFGFRRPDGSSRSIVGLSVDMTLSLPAGWQLIVSRRSDTWGAGVAIETINGGAGVSPMSKFYTFTGSGSLTFLIYNNTGANYTVVAESGTYYLNVANVRVVTSIANKVDTTLTAGLAAGANVTATVGSTARMYVGQLLHIGIPAALGETVTVKQILSSTQFVADFTAAAGIGVNVQAHVIYGDEIAEDLVSTISTLNSNQLDTSLALIDSPGLDMFNESYQDREPADVVDYLAGIGDTTGALWEWGVRDSKRLYFRQQNNPIKERVWYVDISDLDITRLLDLLYNSVYAVYQDTSNRTIRTATTSDTGSVARYGLTRRQALSVSTTSATQAGLQQAVALADGKDPAPQAGIIVDRVFDQSGARWPLWYVSASDTVIIRNLPPSLSSTIDRIRVFRLARCEYSFNDDKLTLEPETPLPKLDALLARLAAGIKPAIH